MKKNKQKNTKYAIFLEGFSERLSKARNNKHLSKAALAKMVGFSSPVQIFRYENGENLPDPFVLSQISEALDVDLHWLITGEIFNPQKRIQARFKETYDMLLKEHEEAAQIVEALESKKKSGQPLTPQEEQELLTGKGRFRATLRQMENFTMNLEDSNLDAD